MSAAAKSGTAASEAAASIQRWRQVPRFRMSFSPVGVMSGDGFGCLYRQIRGNVERLHCWSGSPFDPRAAPLEDVGQLVEVDLAGVASGGLEEGAVGGAEVYAILGGFAGEEAVGEAAGETVAAADA